MEFLFGTCELEPIQDIDLTDVVESNSSDDMDLLSNRTVSFAAETMVDNLPDVLNEQSGLQSLMFSSRVPGGFIQARRHRKRRVNKKWLKRYGYKREYKNALFKGDIESQDVSITDGLIREFNYNLNNIRRIQ